MRELSRGRLARHDRLRGDLAGKGDNLVNVLGTLDDAMDGIALTDPQIADLAAFLNSL